LYSLGLHIVNGFVPKLLLYIFGQIVTIILL
jgi:hypothetical protein